MISKVSSEIPTTTREVMITITHKKRGGNCQYYHNRLYFDGESASCGSQSGSVDHVSMPANTPDQPARGTHLERV